MQAMKPFTLVHSGEMFLTYAEDEQTARAAFVAEGLPKDARIRKQVERAADEFRYTFEGETIEATLVGKAPKLWGVLGHELVEEDGREEIVWDGGRPVDFAETRAEAEKLARQLGLFWVARVKQAEGGWTLGDVHHVEPDEDDPHAADTVPDAMVEEPE